MQLLTLTIKNVRGLRDTTLTFDGKNSVIWGPNGAGKSCVVDAIDFLFTGRISRLTGPGTQGITLNRHGPHIDHAPENASVSAIVRLDGVADPVSIERRMSQPDKLMCPDGAKAVLVTIGESINKGGVILTRRDILRYITAEAGTRADEIQALLRLDDVEKVRSSLRTAKTTLTRNATTARKAIETAKQEVNTTLTLPNYSDAGLLDSVNEARAHLGGEPLSIIRSSDFKQALSPPAASAADGEQVNKNLLRRYVANLGQSAEMIQSGPQATHDKTLRTTITELRDNPELLAEIERLDLTQCASRFVDESTLECPVCGTTWPQGDLRSHLDARIAAAHEAQAKKTSIDTSAESLAGLVRPIVAQINALLGGVNTAQIEGLDAEKAAFANWLAQFTNFITALNEPVGLYLGGDFTFDMVSKLFAPDNMSDLLNRVELLVEESVPESTVEQTAWDTLTKLQESYRVVENRVIDHNEARLFAQRSNILLAEYEKARDTLLEGLYTRVSDRFVGLYNALHDHESEYFSAGLRPNGASLHFEVDFMGRGTHPPHALHSEGHQDSMGVCLFLALNEEVTNPNLNVIVLDDVMMSVDASHRRDLCSLINDQFGHCQFVITTHDKTWASQLKQERVVQPSQMVEFTSWTVDDGPSTRGQTELWDQIQVDLDKGDVKEAAFKLRRSTEDIFESVCDALGAKIPYNSRMVWQLDDWLFPAMGEYKDVLNLAGRAARSWDQQELVAEFTEKESVRKQVYGRISDDQWAINAAVHYNNWENMEKEDFLPVVEAFRDLHGLFVCSSCRRLLEKTPRKGNPEAVKCPCGTVSWNLRRRPGNG